MNHLLLGCAGIFYIREKKTYLKVQKSPRCNAQREPFDLLVSISISHVLALAQSRTSQRAPFAFLSFFPTSLRSYRPLHSVVWPFSSVPDHFSAPFERRSFRWISVDHSPMAQNSPSRKKTFSPTLPFRASDVTSRAVNSQFQRGAAPTFSGGEYLKSCS